MTERYHPIDVKSGDWLLVKPRCYVPTDMDNLWVIKQSDVLGILRMEMI